MSRDANIVYFTRTTVRLNLRTLFSTIKSKLVAYWRNFMLSQPTRFGVNVCVYMFVRCLQFSNVSWFILFGGIFWRCESRENTRLAIKFIRVYTYFLEWQTHFAQHHHIFTSNSLVVSVIWYGWRHSGSEIFRNTSSTAIIDTENQERDPFGV